MNKLLAKLKPQKAPAGERIWELDFIRGLCVALMILDHTLFDLGFVFLPQWFPQGGSGPVYAICDFAANVFWEHPLRLIARMLVLAGFFGGCGLSCSFSRSNVQRGLKLLAVALLLTAATAAMDAILGKQAFFISFGVLHMLAISILIYAALRPAGPVPCLMISAAVVLAGLLIDPAAGPAGFIPYALGIGADGYSADYFPLIPWLGWVLLGGAAGSYLYRERRSYFPRRGQARGLRPFLWLGRHALIVYVLHQAIIYLLLLALGWLAGK